MALGGWRRPLRNEEHETAALASSRLLACDRAHRLLPLVLLARIIHRRGHPHAVDRVREQVPPDVFVPVLAGAGVLERRAARHDGTVGAIGIAADVEVGDQPAGVPVRGRLAVDVDDRAELVHPDQFPTAAVVVPYPAAVEHV
jgi:hypothetical protein